jgi:hypothetical protein
MRDHVSVGDLLVRFHELMNAGAHIELALNGAKVALIAGFRLQQLVPAVKQQTRCSRLLDLAVDVPMPLAVRTMRAWI